MSKLYTNDDLINLIKSQPEQRILVSELELILGYSLKNNDLFRRRIFNLNQKRKVLKESIIRHYGSNSKQAFYYLTQEY